MEKSYKTKRLFWQNIKRFSDKPLKTVGIDDIIIAGMEFNLYDHLGHLNNLFVAANCLNESCFCYEKNNSSKMGCLEGINDTIFKDLINKFLTHAADITYNMEEYKTLPQPPKKGYITFFALGLGGRFYRTLTYEEVQYEEHPYYPFFVYGQQLIRAIRKIELSRIEKEQEYIEKKIKNKSKLVKK